jgi:hypothetical protein
VDEMIGHVRAMALDLRPPLLDELGLVAALRGYAEGQSVRAGVPIAVEANATRRRSGPRRRSPRSGSSRNRSTTRCATPRRRGSPFRSAGTMDGCCCR